MQTMWKTFTSRLIRKDLLSAGSLLLCFCLLFFTGCSDKILEYYNKDKIDKGIDKAYQKWKPILVITSKINPDKLDVYDEIFHSECKTGKDVKLKLICADKFYKDAQKNNIPLGNYKNLRNRCMQRYRDKYGDKKLNELMKQLK